MKTYIYPKTQIIMLLSDNVLETTSQIVGNTTGSKHIGTGDINLED